MIHEVGKKSSLLSPSYYNIGISIWFIVSQVYIIITLMLLILAGLLQFHMVSK